MRYLASGWLERNRKYWKGHDQPVSQLGKDVADILGEVYAGIYHLSDHSLQNVDWTNKDTISIVIRGELATYDGNELSDLMLLCFMLNVRLSVEAAAYQYLRLRFARVGRWGFFRDDMPNLDTYLRLAHVRLADILKGREEIKS